MRHACEPCKMTAVWVLVIQLVITGLVVAVFVPDAWPFWKAALAWLTLNGIIPDGPSAHCREGGRNGSH